MFLVTRSFCCCYHPPDVQTTSAEQEAQQEDNLGVVAKLEDDVGQETDVGLARPMIQWNAAAAQVAQAEAEVFGSEAQDCSSADTDCVVYTSESDLSRNVVEESPVGRVDVGIDARAYGSQVLVVGKKLHPQRSSQGGTGTASFASMPSVKSVETNYSLPAATKPRPANFKRGFSAVAAGHEDSILRDWRDMNEDTDVPEYVIKCKNANEARCYELLQEPGEPLQPFTPTFHGEVDQAELEGEDLRNDYIRLTNLLRPFKHGAHVMDCKVGIRSFSEDEVKNAKLRPDLYQRMLQLDPSAPTESEKEAGACTKYRWMSFNDATTSLSKNGFRIDGIVASHVTPGPELKAELKKLRTLSDMARCIIKYFLPTLSDAEGGDDSGLAELQLQRTVAEAMIQRLAEMRHAMDVSPFVASHTLVGSSILFIVDANGPLSTAYLIDFAKTTLVPNGIVVDHQRPWRQGNHEDGLIIGVDNLSKTWQIVLQILSTSKCT